MRIAFFDTHNYDRTTFEQINKRFGHEITFFEPRLNAESAVLASGYDVACSFVNDKLDEETLIRLKKTGIRLIALRCAGFNHVDLQAAARLELPVVRVPEYSPYAVAEHAMALLLAVNRKIHRAHTRVHELNFSLDGLVGFDLHGKTAGVLGTGRIGRAFVKILKGFGCRVLAYDIHTDASLVTEGLVEYVVLDELLTRSDVISLHLPLTPETRHIIDARAFKLMKTDALLINTSRGGLLDTQALIDALKSHAIGGAGLDVYEEEEGVFFNNLSDHGIDDDLLARLLTFPNVVITSHQAFLTREALQNIATTTLANITAFERDRTLTNQVGPDRQRS
jgi:D-lactate dehydrogenase